MAVSLINEFAPEELNITRRRGDTFPLQIDLGRDITGGSLLLTIDPSPRPADSSTNVAQLIGTALDEGAGTVEFEISENQPRTPPLLLRYRADRSRRGRPHPRDRRIYREAGHHEGEQLMTVPALVVEDGTGLPGANSYLDVTDADDLLSINPHLTDWTAATYDAKAGVLIWATRYLDQKVRWNGKKTVPTSALRWPRTDVKDRDGVEIGENTVPEQVKHATAEMARFLLTDDRSAERSQDGLKELRVDVIELVFNEDYRLPSVPATIQDIIHGLGYVSGARGFKPVVRT
jgi:hypothetical protein